MIKSLARVRSALACTALVAGSVIAAAPVADGATPKPYTSPTVTPIYRDGDANPGQCSSGYLCAYADYGGGWYEFKFYKCGTYNLYYWHDTSVIKADSFVIDDQTNNVLTTYYGKSKNVLQTMRPSANNFQYVLKGNGGWDPIYAIKVC